MEELEVLRARMEQERPVDWDSLPDLSLYMDQVIGYMSRQLIQYGEGERLTSAMVNNYIKDGLLPRAEGKRYSRVHLAYLTAICALKQVLPVKDAGLLAASHTAGEPREMYEHFRRELDAALSEAAGHLDTDCPREELSRLALSLAMRSYAEKLACQQIIELIRADLPQKPDKPKKNRKETKA